MKKLQEFRNKLEEIFEIDKADLDFGIYRIINQKRDELNKFMNNLEEDVKAELKNIGKINIEDKKRELEEKIKQVVDLGYNPDENLKIIALKKEIEESIDIGAIESDIYSHLANFFGRYYSEGDFISQRRYKDGVYALPYAGEEVKLHWANHDQYYIKTSENFNNYIVNFDNGKKLHFKIVEATTERNNNKESEEKERRFFLVSGNPVEVIENELIIKFEYNPSKEKQDKLNNEAVKSVMEFLKADFPSFFELLSKEKKNKEGKAYKNNPNILAYELNNYTAKSSFDYFIHKDLGGFLRRELDFYIKNEVMFLDDIDEEKIIDSLAKIKAIKKIGQKIIAMLESLENFQKKLWEKKKFVVETNYCLTLDKIFGNFDEEEQKGIFKEILSNEGQMKEWKEMYDFDIEGKGIEELKQNDKLIIDTKYFSNEFKENIIAGIENLDEELNGLLIHSENFQALNLLQEKYREKVKCVYIDPPYNTNASEIIYKNGYKHSSWISLMNDRINQSKNLLNNNGLINVAIDEEEQRFLNIIIENLYGTENYIGIIVIQHNPRGRSDAKHLAPSHEYLIIYAKDYESVTTNQLLQSDDDVKNKYSKGDEVSAYRELPLRRSGSNSKRIERPNLFYPIYYNVDKNKLQLNKENENCFEILPIDSSGVERCWRWGKEKVQEVIESEIIVKDNENGYTLYTKDREKNTIKPKSFWYGSKHDASSHGTILLKDIFEKTDFSYPKSINTVKDAVYISSNDDSLILDFFAGSGTTGHAVIDLNREDEGNRKYILVEMGEYFDTVTKPRIKKVIYSKDWKDGKPVSREGISQVFKYIKLEQYEDALNNLVINKPQVKSLFDDKKFEEYYHPQEVRLNTICLNGVETGKCFCGLYVK